MIRLEKHLDAGEGHITILVLKPASIGQGTWALNINAAQSLCFYLGNTSAADADNCTFKTFLAAGTYKMQVLCVKTADTGVLDVDIDDDEVGSIDTYDAGLIWNHIYEVADITVSKSGLKNIRLRCDGKNVASSGYKVYVTVVILFRTA